MTDNAPGWQADPTGRHDHRYWDGSGWTDNVSDAGVASTDPYVAADGGSEPEAPAAADAPGWADPTSVSAGAATDPTSTWPTSPAPPPPPSYAPPAASGPICPDRSGGSKKGLFIGLGVLAAVAVVVALLLAGGGDDDDDGDPIVDDSSVVDDDSDDGDDDPVVDDDPSTDDVEIPDDIEEQIADAYESSLGLSREKAECLADKISGAVQSGELDQEEAMSEIFGYLSDCDIDMSEIGGPSN